MTQLNHHTILFNVAAHTILQLSVEDSKSVWNIVEDTMNGDGLYEGMSKEVILEAYYHQHATNGETWIDLIKDLLVFG